MLNRQSPLAMPYALTTCLAGGIMEILGQKNPQKDRTQQMGNVKEKIHWETVLLVREEKREKLSD